MSKLQKDMINFIHEVAYEGLWFTSPNAAFTTTIETDDIRTPYMNTFKRKRSRWRFEEAIPMDGWRTLDGATLVYNFITPPTNRYLIHILNELDVPRLLEGNRELLKLGSNQRTFWGYQKDLKEEVEAARHVVSLEDTMSDPLAWHGRHSNLWLGGEGLIYHTYPINGCDVIITRYDKDKAGQWVFIEEKPLPANQKTLAKASLLINFGSLMTTEDIIKYLSRKVDFRAQ